MGNKVEELKKERKRKKRKNMIMLPIFVMVAYIIFACVALVLIENKISIDEKNQWNYGWTILSLELLHFGLSFRRVGPTSLGAVLIFGRPIYQVRSGLVYLPFIVCQLVKDGKNVVPVQFPSAPELVDKSGLDDRPVPPGLVKPIRVTTASKEMLTEEYKVKLDKNKNLKKLPLNEMMTLEPSVFVRYQRRNDDYISFLSNIGNDDKAMIAMRDTVDAVLRIEFAKRTTVLILMEQDEINKTLLEKIEILVGEIPDPKRPDLFNPEDSWGINILNVQLTDVDLSKKINQSLRDIVDSQLRKTADITKAEGDKKVKELAGEGERKFKTDDGTGVANARFSLLEAEAKGFEKIAKVAETEEGKLALLAKATEQGLKGSQYSIVPDGAGSLIAGMMEVLKKTASRETPKKVEEDLKSNKGDKK